MGGKGPIYSLVPISSQISNTEFALKEWSAAGLNVACGIKAQIATVEERLVVESSRHPGARGSTAINARLKAWLEL